MLAPVVAHLAHPPAEATRAILGLMSAARAPLSADQLHALLGDLATRARPRPGRSRWTARCNPRKPTRSSRRRNPPSRRHSPHNQPIPFSPGGPRDGGPPSRPIR